MWGNIIFSDSMEDVQWAMANHYKVIALVDDPTPYRQFSDIVPLSNLLPPTAAITSEIDGDKVTAEAIYRQYLNTKDPMESIGVVLLALMAGINVMIYLPIDESMAFNFIQIFAQYFAEQFGINIGSMAVPATMIGDPQHMACIANLLYSFDYIPFSQYCMMMPAWVPPAPVVIDKMMKAMCYNFPGGMDECVKFCMTYIANSKNRLQTETMGQAQANAGKQNPMFLMDDVKAADII